MSLLFSDGFSNIHFTHGQVEFGKDFIARRQETDTEMQYSFQSKVGNLNLADWTNRIQGQMLQCAMSGLNHPGFDAQATQRFILVLTGSLSSPTSLAITDFNRFLEGLNLPRIEVWDRESLIEKISRTGFRSVYNATPAEFSAFGRFFGSYGQALRGDLTDRDIEDYTRFWVRGDVCDQDLALRCCIEGEILSRTCLETGEWYEAAYIYCAIIRTLLWSISRRCRTYDAAISEQLLPMAMRSLQDVLNTSLQAFAQEWKSHGCNSLVALPGPPVFITYPVLCMRVIETASLLCLLNTTESGKAIASFLSDFIGTELGCTKPTSNRYAISIVLSVLVLVRIGRVDEAKTLLRKITIWLCDRVQFGWGLASVEASIEDEVATLIDQPDDNRCRRDSFLATALADLTAFIGDTELYSFIVNDIKAVGIIPQYWQAQDTPEQFLFEGGDVVQYPNIEFDDVLTPFGEYNYSEHIRHEPELPMMADQFLKSYLPVIVFLRDRYFPKMWPFLVGQ